MVTEKEKRFSISPPIFEDEFLTAAGSGIVVGILDATTVKRVLRWRRITVIGGMLTVVFAEPTTVTSSAIWALPLFTGTARRAISILAITGWSPAAASVHRRMSQHRRVEAGL